MAIEHLQTISTPWGEERLARADEPGDLAGLEMDRGFGRFNRFRSFFETPEALARQLEPPAASLALALAGNVITAYALLRPPPAEDRWSELSDPPMFELIVEAARGRRNGHVVKPLIGMLVERPENDERVVYLVAYSWTWDLEGSGKTLEEYRQTLIALVKDHGFRVYPTNEPNVSLREENLFMARLGKAIEEDRPRKRLFTNLLFGIQDEW